MQLIHKGSSQQACVCNDQPMESRLPPDIVTLIHGIASRERYSRVLAELRWSVAWVGLNPYPDPATGRGSSDIDTSQLRWRRTRRAFVDAWGAPAGTDRVSTLTTYDWVPEPLGAVEELDGEASRSFHDCWHVIVDTRVLVQSRGGVEEEVGVLSHQMDIQHGPWGVTAHWECPPFGG